MIVCNFPSIIASYRQHGWRADYFSPAHDPEMDEYAPTEDRPIDVLFVGGYSRHHRRRAAVLEAVAALMDEFRVVFCVDRSRLTRLAESNLGRLLPMGEHRRPPNVRAVSKGPVFGRDLYAMISRAKIVLNGAVDMAALDRSNMRCFEALGCGDLLVSDWGNYPPGLEDGETMMLYSNPEDAPAVIQEALANPERSRSIAAHGYQAVRTLYNKDRQWDDFVRLVETL